MSITGPIAGHARRDPEATALMFEGRNISWAALDAAIARIAGFLASDRGSVALDLPNGPALAALFLGVARAGREVLIFDPSWPGATARTMLAALSPALAITSRKARAKGSSSVDPDAFPDEVATSLGASDKPLRAPEPMSSAVFYTGFTSGSTGLPKGFRRTHGSWVASFEGLRAEFGINPRDVVFAPGPLSHSTPLYALANAIYEGATIVLARGFQPHNSLRTIAAEGVSVLFAVPTHLLLLIEAAEVSGTACPNVRLILSSGAKWPDALSVRLRKVFPEALFAEFYGASELSFVALARSDENVPEGSVGRAFPGVAISVRDRLGRKLPSGRTGLVFAESALTFAGYAAGQGEIARSGDALSAGDRGFLDERGFLHLTGRADRMFITSGRNIQPEEIERALETCPVIADAAVLGIADERRGRRPIALIRFHDGASVGPFHLIRHLRQSLPPHKVPRRYMTVRNWPRTPSGKTDFAALEKLHESGGCEVLA